ncbi:hypothetical protein BDB01DRAFT_791258 [Pilobolus umbonatus]|nr:hypothetical protein BDB01DRAFT_791258 [Pilobolus umbonatus]
MDNTQDNEQQRFVQRQSMNRSSFYMLLFLLSLLFFNFSDDNSLRTGKLTKEELLEELQNEKLALNNLTFGVNITNPVPSTVKSSIKELWNIHQSPASHYYHNVTGIFRGEWINNNMSIPDSMNKTEIDTARNNFHFDGSGTFSLNLKSTSTKNVNINYLEGYIRMKDSEKSDNGALLLAGGIHFLNNGTLYLMIVPEGYPLPLDELLHMLPSNHTFVNTRGVLEEQIDKRIEELTHEAYWDYQSMSESDLSSLPFTCTFQMYAQLHPVSHDIKNTDLLDYERELQNPHGISTITPPPLILSSELYSPQCRLSLSVHKESGIKIEVYYSKAITYAGIASIIAAIQIFTLIHQMEYTPTPSSVSNVSYWTIAMQAIMDGYLCLLHLTTGVVIEEVFIPFVTAAFFTFVLVSIFGMRYLLVVWRIQRPESIRASQPPSPTPDTPNTSTEFQNTTPDTQTLLPVANTRRVARPSTDDSNPQREVTYLYYRLYAVLLLGLFLFYQSVTRSAFVQNIIIGSLGFIFFSFWIPQIVRNILRGCRHPLSHRYVIVMSVTRLYVPLYFYGCPVNLVGHETTPWVWALVLYVAVQVMILLFQDLFGPRFFIPSRYLPQTYNYHPLLSSNDEETINDGDHSDINHHANRDCAICMLPIDTLANNHSGINVLSRASYMVTPCHHIFHTECLEKWMRIKLECPVCRAYLPAC